MLKSVTKNLILPNKKNKKMQFLYNLIIFFASQIIKLLTPFSRKIKLFVNGRKEVFSILESKIKSNDKTIWFHAASLGEYEQGLPVIEKMKEKFPKHKIVITFFSPSGYEVRKNNDLADVTVYLPLDTKNNAKKFIQLVHPEMAFFIKYEYWPNYLFELKKQSQIFGTKTYLISGVFSEEKVFFQWYGGFFRKAIKTFDYFFVQNESSKKLLQSIGFNNVKVSGDTRFDRVASILERDNSLDFIESFKNNQTTIVVGSSWARDEELLVKYINNNKQNVKFIIAPHNIKSGQIACLKKRIKKPTVLYSEKENKDLSQFQVFIIDTIGILTKIYSYADIAYVGGGYGTPGIHNILEPATFGVPIIIGPNYTNFPAAASLVFLDGCNTIYSQIELDEILDHLISNTVIRHEKGHICETFVQMNKGATNIIVNHIETQ